MHQSAIRSYGYQIYNSIIDVELADWQRLAGATPDLGMDPRMIRVLEETLADQCRMWIITVTDPIGALVACACLSLFVVDAVCTSPSRFAKSRISCADIGPGFSTSACCSVVCLCQREKTTFE